MMQNAASVQRHEAEEDQSEDKESTTMTVTVVPAEHQVDDVQADDKTATEVKSEGGTLCDKPQTHDFQTLQVNETADKTPEDIQENSSMQLNDSKPKPEKDPNGIIDFRGGAAEAQVK